MQCCLHCLPALIRTPHWPKMTTSVDNNNSKRTSQLASTAGTVPDHNSNNTNTVSSHKLGQVFDELRQEIHKVKFPKRKRPNKMNEKKLKITFLTPDGKKVKQTKEQQGAALVKLDAKTTKGDVYVREDGKIVRLVKKKDKKKKQKEREERKRYKQEMKRIRQEAELKAQMEEEAAAAAAAAQADLSEEKKQALKDAWRGDKITQTTEAKRSHFDTIRSSFVMDKEKIAAELALHGDDVEEYADEVSDDDSIGAPGEDPLDRSHNASTYTFQSCSTGEALDMLRDPSCDTLPSVQLQEDVKEAMEEQKQRRAARQVNNTQDDATKSTSKLTLDDSDSDNDDDDEALRLFYISLEDEQGKTYVQRMTEKSVEQLRAAESMRRQSDFHKELADVKAARFRAVNLPKHPTQSSNYRRSTLAA